MKNAIIIIIILIAAFLRLWQIGENPAGFFTDEASNGLNAYKIATTGRDAHDKPFPVIFEANGDWRDPVYIYSLVPSIVIFGLNEFSVRIVSALYGIGAVIIIYFLGKEIGGEKIGIVSSALLAISPWHIHFSRVGFQLIVSVFWILFSLLFLYKSLKNRNYFILVSIGLILSFFSYSTTKLYIAPLLILFLISNWQDSAKLIKSKLVWIIGILSIFVVFGLIYPYVKDGKFFTRWKQVNHEMTVSKGLQSYVNHFSYDFLFSKGDAGFFGQDVKRHSIIGLGELHYFQLPFIVVALILVLRKKHIRQKYNFFFIFLLIYPLGTVFTQEQPQASRSILGVIPFQILTAMGIVEIMSLLKSRASRYFFAGVFIAVIGISVYHLGVKLYEYPLKSADYWGWQYGYRPIMSDFQKQESNYDELIVTHRFNSGHELLDFYKVTYDCTKCIVMTNPITIDASKKQLFAVRQDDIDEAFKKYPLFSFKVNNFIYLPDGSMEIVIGEFIDELFYEKSLFSDDRTR